VASGATTLIKTTVSGEMINIAVQRDASEVYVESRDVRLSPRGNMISVTGFRVEITTSEAEDIPDYALFADAYVKLGYRDDLGEPLQWTQNFPLTEAKGIFRPRFRARYIRAYLADDFVRINWKCSALEVYGNEFKGRQT
jgi:hypothetical protein